MRSHRLFDLQVVPDDRGNLAWAEGGGRHIPFDIRRIFFLYDVPAGAVRAGHALRDVDQVLIAASGTFDVVLDDGERRTTVTLDDPAKALHIEPLVWRELEAFSAGAVCLVLASEPYSEQAYYREYDGFLAAVRG